MIAPLAAGQHVTVGQKQDRCHRCGSADLVFLHAADASNGLFECANKNQGGHYRLTIIRPYDAVTPIDAATDHAESYPRPSTPERARQTCPVEWCRLDHTRPVMQGVHATDDLLQDPLQATLCIAQINGDRKPFVLLTSAQHAATIQLDARQARAMASLFDGDPGPAFHTGLAHGLRQAADRLDAITSGSGS